MQYTFAEIADEAIKHGDYETAYSVMKDQSESDGYAVLSGNELRLWAAQFEDDIKNLRAAAANSVKAEIAADLIKDPNSELTLNKPEVMLLMKGLVTAGVLSQNAKDALLAQAAQTKPRWPGLKKGYVQWALTERAGGRI